MTTVETPPPIDTLADLLERLGGIAPDRVRFRPPPGTATEQDVIEIERRENRLCELVDGVLVEKPMRYRESLLAGALLAFLREFVVPRNLGLVTGADGLMIEVHHSPETAFSDGVQSLLPRRFAAGMAEIRKVARAVGRTV